MSLVGANSGRCVYSILAIVLRKYSRSSFFVNPANWDSLLRRISISRFTPACLSNSKKVRAFFLVKPIVKTVIFCAGGLSGIFMIFLFTFPLVCNFTRLLVVSFLNTVSISARCIKKNRFKAEHLYEPVLGDLMILHAAVSKNVFDRKPQNSKVTAHKNSSVTVQRFFLST